MHRVHVALEHVVLGFCILINGAIGALGICFVLSLFAVFAHAEGVSFSDERTALAWHGASASDIIRAKRCAPPFGCPRKEKPASGDKSLYHGMVDEAASAQGVPLRIAHAVIRSESNYNPNARSSSGAIGLGQILCRTARGVGFSGSCSALYEPRTNLTYSLKYLAQALRKGGNGCSGVSLYNTGTAAAPRCTGYGRMVMARVI